jgi:glycosyltransferase involved in cell wall biosynthesis
MADLFACVNDYGGVSKPVMEAMASSLPIVTKRPLWEDAPELIEDIAMVTDGSPEGFEKAFLELSNDREKMDRLGRMAFERVSAISGTAMEDKEAGVIMSVVKGASHGQA